MNYRRRPLSRTEFDDRCRRLEELRPDLSQTSGARSRTRNRLKGGASGSKHFATAARPAMARDYVPDATPLSVKQAEELEHLAKLLGLWALYEFRGKAREHLHVQGRGVG